MTFGDFLRFDEYVTLYFIPIIYVIGAALVTISGILVLENMLTLPGIPDYYYYDNPTFVYVVGIVFLVVGNVSWRIACELVAVLFSINEKLSIIAEEQSGEDE